MNAMRYTPQDIGKPVRETRKGLGVTQKALALTSGTGLRFIIELASGKETAETGKVLTILQSCDKAAAPGCANRLSRYIQRTGSASAWSVVSSPPRPLKTAMPFLSYIVGSKASGRFYVGHTKNFTKRIFEHHNNRMLSIKPNAEHAAVELWHLAAPWFHG
jgi:hypothetical protein